MEREEKRRRMRMNKIAQKMGRRMRMNKIAQKMEVFRKICERGWILNGKAQKMVRKWGKKKKEERE